MEAHPDAVERFGAAWVPLQDREEAPARGQGVSLPEELLGLPESPLLGDLVPGGTLAAIAAACIAGRELLVPERDAGCGHAPPFSIEPVLPNDWIAITVAPQPGSASEVRSELYSIVGKLIGEAGGSGGGTWVVGPTDANGDARKTIITDGSKLFLRLSTDFPSIEPWMGAGNPPVRAVVPYRIVVTRRKVIP